MNQNSDSESHDSDEGLRYKTESIRYKGDKNISRRSRFRSRSPRNRENEKILNPQLPPHFKSSAENSFLPMQNQDANKLDMLENDESYFGPALPPHLLNKTGSPQNEDTESVSIGPQLPPSFQKHPECTPQESEKSYLSVDDKETTDHFTYIGPILPPHLRKTLPNDLSPEQSDDEVYGPLPPDASINSKAHIALEERALELKLHQLTPGTDASVVREEWMLELPEVKAPKFGLGPRQFRSKVGPDLSDRSSWTDTPDKKQKPEKKLDLKKIAELQESMKKDAEQERIAKKLKKNKESLLEIHQSKLKEKTQNEGPSERRPFSRDIDLQVNRFDEAQKKAVLKKAQLLDDRFSSGQSKFL